jgi:hypothetical protein
VLHVLLASGVSTLFPRLFTVYNERPAIMPTSPRLVEVGPSAFVGIRRPRVQVMLKPKGDQAILDRLNFCYFLSRRECKADRIKSEGTSELCFMFDGEYVEETAAQGCGRNEMNRCDRSDSGTVSALGMKINCFRLHPSSGSRLSAFCSVLIISPPIFLRSFLRRASYGYKGKNYGPNTSTLFFPRPK